MMPGPMRVAVVGATGFIGSATVQALQMGGHAVVPVKAPRLASLSERSAAAYIESRPRELGRLIELLGNCDSVVNAAGLPDATSGDSGQQIAVNGVLPGLIAAATCDARARRLVHVSSAAVQGRRLVLDETDEFDDFSPYSHSKRLGEELVHRYSKGRATVYRPPGVHGVDRSLTRLSARVSASALASVAKPAHAPSPQALIGNVAAAISYLATSSEAPPRVVIHPWEGLSTSEVVTLLGGRKPFVVPRALARAVISTGATVGRLVPWVAGNVRRLEMMWFGQRQGSSWLTRSGWTPPIGRDGWVELGTSVRARQAAKGSRGKGAE